MKDKSIKNNIFIQKNKFLPAIIISIVSVVLIIIITIVSYNVHQKTKDNSVSAMYKYWNLGTEEGYKKVYQISSDMLKKNARHNNALIFKGYSSFMLSETELDKEKAISYMDEAIFSLRNALYNCNRSKRGQVEYMLGKCYFYKNKISNYYYYSDLVIKYLTLAEIHKFKADDIAELKGLSYDSLKMSDESLMSYTQALLVRETDTLLLNIAKQYYYKKQYSIAKQYIFRVLEITEDEDVAISSHLLLGRIYTEEQNYTEAKKEFENVIQKDEKNADAYYGLGVLYEKIGDSIKAKAMYRRCLRIQSNHPEASKKQ